MCARGCGSVLWCVRRSASAKSICGSCHPSQPLTSVARSSTACLWLCLLVVMVCVCLFMGCVPLLPIPPMCAGQKGLTGTQRRGSLGSWPSICSTRRKTEISRTCPAYSLRVFFACSELLGCLRVLGCTVWLPHRSLSAGMYCLA